MGPPRASRGRACRRPSGRPRPERRALEIADVVVQLGEVRILDRLSLAFERPGIYCVIGPNGAGKTSTFNMLTGELPAQAGRVTFDGQRDRTAADAPDRASGHRPEVPDSLGVRAARDRRQHRHRALERTRAPAELLRPRLRRWSSAALDELQARHPFLADAERTAAQLSHGERQTLELAMALLGEPRLLLLDEPCAGLSPLETVAAIELIGWASRRPGRDDRRHRARHEPGPQARRPCLRAAQRRLVAEGSVAAIQANAAVQAIYVGAEK